MELTKGDFDKIRQNKTCKLQFYTAYTVYIAIQDLKIVKLKLRQISKCKFAKKSAPPALRSMFLVECLTSNIESILLSQQSTWNFGVWVFFSFSFRKRQPNIKK